MTEKCFIENTSSRGKIELPGYATFDLGVKYNTKINTIPVKLSLMCYNVFNKSARSDACSNPFSRNSALALFSSAARVSKSRDILALLVSLR